MSQVSGGRSEQVSRARSLLSRALVCIWLDLSMGRSGLFDLNRLFFMGRPAFPFIGQGKAHVIVEGQEENEKEKKSSRIAGSFFSFTRVPPTL